MLKQNLMVLAVFLALCGSVFSEPMVQISNYTLIPQDIYPGTYGYAQLSLNNVGDATASSVTVHYDYRAGGEESEISVGDIASGSSSVVLVPFQVYQQGGTIQDPQS